MSINQPQPAPRAVAGRTPAWELVMVDARDAGASEQVLADMAERHAIGTKKYGTPLCAGDGRNHLIDAYQEQLDLVVYLRQELDERGVDMAGTMAGISTSTKSIMRIYAIGIGTLESLRVLIALAEKSAVAS